MGYCTQGRETESPQLCVHQRCKYILRIFTVQCGGESTSEWHSLGEKEAMSETKNLVRTLPPTLILVVSEKIHQVTPEFNTGAKELSGPALYTLPTQLKQVMVEPAALVSIERWILSAGGGRAVKYE